MASHILATLPLLLALTSFVLASDPSPLQDFCVATDEPSGAVFVNGRFCKNPALATADDFYLSGFHVAGNTSSVQGISITPANVIQIPGLNTLGIFMVRLDFQPYGLNPPHTHPRGSEILVVLEGTLYVGFVTSSRHEPNYHLISKTLNQGDVFVFPQGLVHFQENTGATRAVAISYLSSQDSGVIYLADAMFGPNPAISDRILTKALQVKKGVVDQLRAPFRPAHQQVTDS